MRAAFRTRILTASLGDELIKVYQWSNFDTTIDRLIAEQPKRMATKGIHRLAPICCAPAMTMPAKYIVKNLGEDESKWTWVISLR